MRFHNHHTWTFPAHKMIPPSMVRGWYERNTGRTYRRCKYATKSIKRVHKSRSKRWLKQQMLKDVNDYFNE